MWVYASSDILECVALRKESVDRNIPSNGTLRNTHNVALRKESVDRNDWCYCTDYRTHIVALRKESVDRNNAMNMTERNNDSRSPQGERG